MIRFGVCSLQELCARQLNDVFGKEKNISIELYEELQNSNTASAEEYQETVLGHFKFGQVFKRTHADRFAEFDELILSSLSQQLGSSRKPPIKIHDLAASDGRTSLELYQRLTAAYASGFDFLATDILPWVYLISS